MKSGLYLVATPIGNLQDITYRAVETLKNVDYIYCEDTRVTGKLCNAYGISTPLKRYDEHNAASARHSILEHLRSNLSVALVSDAGTPLISDPGFKLVQAVQEADFHVTTIPGACAAIAAITLSGLPTDQFFFAGFFQKKNLSLLDKDIKTIIFYESPRRVVKTLEQIAQHNSRLDVSVIREITKIYEERISGNVEDVRNQLNQRPSIKGEIVIVVHGNSDESNISDEDITNIINQRVAKNESHKDIVKYLCHHYSIKRQQAYNLTLKAIENPSEKNE